MIFATTSFGPSCGHPVLGDALPLQSSSSQESKLDCPYSQFPVRASGPSITTSHSVSPASLSCSHAIPSTPQMLLLPNSVAQHIILSSQLRILAVHLGRATRLWPPVPRFHHCWQGLVQCFAPGHTARLRDWRSGPALPFSHRPLNKCSGR